MNELLLLMDNSSKHNFNRKNLNTNEWRVSVFKQLLLKNRQKQSLIWKFIILLGFLYKI